MMPSMKATMPGEMYALEKKRPEMSMFFLGGAAAIDSLQLWEGVTLEFCIQVLVSNWLMFQYPGGVLDTKSRSQTNLTCTNDLFKRNQKTI